MTRQIEFYFGVWPRRSHIRLNLLNPRASVVALEPPLRASMSLAYFPPRQPATRPGLKQHRIGSPPPAGDGASADRRWRTVIRLMSGLVSRFLLQVPPFFCNFNPLPGLELPFCSLLPRLSPWPFTFTVTSSSKIISSRVCFNYSH